MKVNPRDHPWFPQKWRKAFWLPPAVVQRARRVNPAGGSLNLSGRTPAPVHKAGLPPGLCRPVPTRTAWWTSRTPRLIGH